MSQSLLIIKNRALDVDKESGNQGIIEQEIDKKLKGIQKKNLNQHLETILLVKFKQAIETLRFNQPIQTASLMQICLRINLCISYSLILLSAIWFVFVIIINNRGQDPRINQLNLMTAISEQFSEGIYLRKIEANEQLRELSRKKGERNEMVNSFQLIEIMNDESPNMVGDEVILIVSITNEKLDLSSIKFAQYLYSKNNQVVSKLSNEKVASFPSSSQSEPPAQIPIYILRQTQPVLLNNQKHLISYKQQIQQTLNYFVNILDIKKLSLLSFEIGALLTLYSLALETDARVFTALNKLVLINPFSLAIKVFHSPPLAFVENYIKPAILETDEKFNMFNTLRLIIISTTRTVFHQSERAEQYFTFSYKKQPNLTHPTLHQHLTSFSDPSQQLYRFNNTFTISTRSMSNVFCFFDKQIYFFYEPFISLLSRFFIEDSRKQFSYDEMEYYFHYRELPEVKELSQRTKRKYISKCMDFSLENYHYGGNTFGGEGKQHQQCIRLLRKQSIYFEESSILLYSKEKFQVYGQNFQKLYPYQSKTVYMVYHVERVNQFTRLFIINRKSALIHMKIAPIFMPLTNPIVSLEAENPSLPISTDLSQLSFQNLTNFQVIRTCEPANLIFPLHFAKMARFGQHSLLFNKQSNNKNCYSEYDNYDFYPDWFALNWNILRNTMIFTMFVSHVLGKHLAARFYTQSLVNELIMLVANGNLLLFENFIILSTLCVFDTVLRYLMMGMDYFAGVRRVVVKFMWLPVLIELGSVYYPTLPSSWKVLFLLIGLCTSKHNIYIILIKFCFIIDSIRFDTGNIKGIISLCLWTFVAAFDHKPIEKPPKNHHLIEQAQQQKNNQLKKKVLDMCFLFSIGVCIDEDGSVIDEIINAYIVMQTILYINNRFL